MSLNLGELVGFIGLDDGPFAEGLAANLANFREHGGKLTALAAGIGAGAAVALGAALMGAMEQQDVGAKVAAQLGGGTEDAAMYGKLAGKIYGQNFGESLSAVGDALRAVQQANIVPANAGQDVLQDLTQKALAFSSVFGKDVPASVNAVSQMLKTGMAKDATEAFDLLTRAEQQGVDKADDLLDVVTEYGTQFRKVGVEGPAAMGLLSQGLKAGARDADIVADAIKEFSIRAIDGSKSSADAFTALGLDADKMTAQIAQGGPAASAGLQTVLDKLRGIKDPAQQAQIATGLFGTQAEDLGQALFALDPSKATAAMGDFAGATDKAGKTASDTASGNLESFKRQLHTAFVETVGGKVLPPVMKMTKAIADDLSPALKGAGEWIKKNREWLEPLGVFLGTFAGTILVVVAAVKVWQMATAAYTAVQAALNLVMMANPIGLIIIAVVALVAAIIYLWNHSAAFRDFWIAVWDIIKGAALAVWDFLVAAAKLWWKTFSGFWTGVGEFFVGLWDGIVSGVKTAWHWITDTFDKVVTFVGSLPKKIGDKARGMWDGIKDSFRAAVNWLIGKWNDLSLTIGGGTIMGVHIPSVTLSTPNIPMLADGGVVRATPGGRMVGVGEGGEDEAVAPLSTLAGMVAGAVREALAGADRGQSGDLVVVVDGEVIERRSLAAIKRNPVDVHLASRAGARDVAFAGA